MAFVNIKKNGKFYVPYLITCIFTISMYYIMCFVAKNKGLKKIHGADQLAIMMQLGSYIVAIFSIIFLFYTNSFLMKRRKKEFGLYHILGMEKKHITKIIFLETVYSFILTYVIGILTGTVFSKLILMLLCKMLNFDVRIRFALNAYGVVSSLFLFGFIFFLTLIANLITIKRSNPIELLHGTAQGEKEPRTKFILTIIGFITIGIGYYIALKTKQPLEALKKFFIAVILVIIGTYCLFTAASIAILKMLRKNKKYYYQAKHFNSVSSMIYRMKKNAVGLANICILSTMVLVIVSTTVSLYIGAETSLKHNFPTDIELIKHNQSEELQDSQNQNLAIYEKLEKAISDKNIEVRKLTQLRSLELFVENNKGSKNSYKVSKNAYGTDSRRVFEILTLENYNNLTTENKVDHLADNEVLIYNECGKINDSFKLMDSEYKVKKHVKEFYTPSGYDQMYSDVQWIVVANDDVLNKIAEQQSELSSSKTINYSIRLDMNGSDQEKIDFYKYIKDYTDYGQCRQEIRDSFYALYGGLLFIGIFLGILFLTITVLIIYYKQITEGYEDKQRFEIMQKVGMSKVEVKKSIQSQILTVFMLPILAASVHVCASFTMIKKLLAVMGLTDVGLFKTCTIITIVVFTAIYALVYWLTSKVYYKIVES